MVQSIGSPGIFNWNNSSNNKNKVGMVGGYDFFGFGSDGFQFHQNPTLIMNKEQRIEDGFDNGCKRMRLTLQNQRGINAPFDPTKDLLSKEEEESSPLGLTLRKTPSFLDLVEKKLSQGSFSRPETVRDTSPAMDSMSNEDLAAQTTGEKLKASNFSATLLRIGSWERISRYEGDLVAKCYYAKRKLVWEVLDCGLKSKIEVQWSDISAIKATFLENQPGILEVELHHAPLFFRETNPQPRKHTLWQAASDFTGGQAPICRRHFLQFPEGILEKHYEKLLQCDFRLNLSSQKPFPSSSSLYFESCNNGCQDYPFQMNNHHAIESSYSAQFRNFFPTGSVPDSHQQVQKFESPRPSVGAAELYSPNSVIDLPSSEDISRKASDEQKARILENGGYKFASKKLDQVQALDSTTKNRMADSHYPLDCILPRGFSYNLLPFEAGMEGFSSNKSVLEEIAKHLLGDQLAAICSDEQKIIKKVNSMCSLINGASFPDSTNPEVKIEQTGHQQSMNNSVLLGNPVLSNLGDGCRGLNMPPVQESRAENPLLHLPRMASLPTLFLEPVDDFATVEPSGAWNQWRWQC